MWFYAYERLERAQVNGDRNQNSGCVAWGKVGVPWRKQWGGFQGIENILYLKKNGDYTGETVKKTHHFGLYHMWIIPQWDFY